MTIKKGVVAQDKGGNVQLGFSSIFWNTAWTQRQAPHTLGLLIDNKHKALKQFPTSYHSDYQWWDAVYNGQAVEMKHIDKNIKPIVRIIDDNYTGRSLGFIFECKIGKGKLLFCATDLNKDISNRISGQQLKNSLISYMQSVDFNPKIKVNVDKITSLFVK